MILTVGCQNKNGTRSLTAKIWMVMRLTIVLLLFFTFQVSANGYAQQITIVKKNASLSEVFKAIERQTHFLFFYDKDLIQKAEPIDINVKNATIEQALLACLRAQPFTYSIVKNTIVVRAKETVSTTVVAVEDIPALPPPPVQIKGRVVNKEGNPLQGVSVLVAGTKNGTTTNNDGRFMLSVQNDENIVLEISSVGYQTKTVKVGKQTEIDVTLELNVSDLSDVVVVGYGTQKRSSVTASISKVQNDILDQVPSGRVETALAGRIAGVYVSERRNTPGTAPDITIRGSGSISGGNNPLIVIDGFPGGDLGQLDMNDVESFEVLKDASSAAIYGSRGSGGVILVTTKRGKSGKPNLDLNVYYGISQPIVHHDWMVGEEWYNYLVKYNNREFSWVGGNPSIPVFGDPLRPPSYQVNPRAKEPPQTVWQNEVIQTAPIQNYNLSVRGGTENIKYYVSGAYSYEGGSLKTAWYEKYNFRANLDIKISKLISFGMELNPSYTRQRVTLQTMTPYVSEPPFVSPKPVNGRYPQASDYIPTGFSSFVSPYALLYGAKNYNMSFANLGRAFLNFELTDGLNLKTSVGTNLGFYNISRFNGGINDPSVPLTGGLGRSQSINLINENVLSYTKTLHKIHSLGGVLGASYQKNNSENVQMNAVSNSFNNDIVETLNNAIVNPSTSTQTKSQWGLMSYFGRVNYAYKDKYLFAASFRTDGSSRFGADNKWGNFPSISAAWRVSKEDFMQNVSAISELKLRASYGVTGNFNIGDFQYLGTVGGGVFSPDNKTVNSTAQTSLDNPELSWERVTGYDLGIELGFFDNRLNIVFDYYDKNTNGMLYNVNVPAITGFTDAIKNIGIVRNRGVDIEINTKNLVGSFKWNTSFNASSNKNEVVDLGGVGERVNTLWSMGWLLRKGVPMFSYYGYKMIGVFQNADQVAQLPHLTGTKPGNPIIKDQNGDGKIDPQNDRVVLGSYQPKVLLGLSNQFSWKRFDLSIFLQASLGAKLFNIESQTYQGTTNGPLRRSLVENEWWSEDDPGDGKTPAASLSQLFGWNTNTDYYIEDGSYLRLRNLNFGYNLSTFAKTIGIRSLRAYVSMTNLWLIKSKNNYSYNPEGVTSGVISGINSTPGFNQGSEPINRTMVFGVNVGF